MNLLVIAAHPDDEVLGCGGTIAKLAKEGARVTVAYMAQGGTSRYAKGEPVDPAWLPFLRSCAQKVAQVLGVAKVRHFDFPDNRFDAVDLLDLNKAIIGLLAEERPDWVFTHHGGDLNVDHAKLFRSTLIAMRPMEGLGVERLCAYEVPSATDWAFHSFEPMFRPNFFVDIEGTLEEKITAMEAYESEKRVFPHPRSPEALRANATRWGSVVGLRAAEAFELVWEIRK